MVHQLPYYLADHWLQQLQYEKLKNTTPPVPFLTMYSTEVIKCVWNEKYIKH